jgi:hypothetical protein
VNFLNVFEERVGSIFGAAPQGFTAPFSFKKLAKKAAHEMENETFVINGVDTAPALYTILVSPDDDAAMRPLYPQLTQETSQFIEGQAQRRGYAFVGQPLVRFMVDPSLRSGKFSVFAENVDVRTLNRLHQEESAFLGNSVGGAAAEAAPVRRDGALGARQKVSPSARQAAPVLRAVEPKPMGSTDAGLDVMPSDLDLNEPGIAAVANALPVIAPISQEPVSPGDYSESMPVPPAPVAPAAAAAGDVALTPLTQRRPASTPLVDPRRNAVDAAAMGMAGAPAATRQPVVSAAPQQQATCLLIDRQSGRTYTAAAPRTIIGRERNSGGIMLRDPNVSRRHAELSYDGASWHITDLNSTNGTLVNDVDIDECVLRDGDLITLGLVNLEFRG